jgi:hypothetical protein
MNRSAPRLGNAARTTAELRDLHLQGVGQFGDRNGGKDSDLSGQIGSAHQEIAFLHTDLRHGSRELDHRQGRCVMIPLRHRRTFGYLIRDPGDPVPPATGRARLAPGLGVEI